MITNPIGESEVLVKYEFFFSFFFSYRNLGNHLQCDSATTSPSVTKDALLHHLLVTETYSD